MDGLPSVHTASFPLEAVAQQLVRAKFRQNTRCQTYATVVHFLAK
jgi:hypothetical protein